jgi:hypothetical protein
MLLVKTRSRMNLLLLLVGLLVVAKPKFTGHLPVVYFAKPVVVEANKITPPYVALIETLSSADTTNRPDEENHQPRKVISLSTVEIQNKYDHERIAIAEQKLELRQKEFVPLNSFSESESDNTKEELPQVASPNNENGADEVDWRDQLSEVQKLRLSRANIEDFETSEEEGSEFRRAAEKAILQQKTIDPRNSSVQVYHPEGKAIDRAKVELAEIIKPQAPSVFEGHLRLADGAAIGPDDIIEIRKFEDGIPKEVGSVNLLEGSYRIELNGQQGSIIAKIINKRGRVIAEGVRRQLTIGDNSKDNAKNEIVIRPTEKRALSQFAAADSFDGIGKPAVLDIEYANLNDKTKTDKFGQSHLEALAKGSLVLVRAEGNGFAKMNSLIVAGKDKIIPAIPAEMKKSLTQILNENRNQSYIEQTNSLTWGKVTRDGVPISGAKVEVEGHENAQPIYLNSLWIPDPSLKMTTENGLFVISNLPEGYHSLLVTKGESYFVHSNIVSERNTVSVAEVEATAKKEYIDIKVFDAFEGSPQTATVAFQGLPDAVDITGFLRADFQQINQVSIASILPSDDYLPMLITYSDQTDFIHLPLLPKDWMNSLISQQRVDDVIGTGFIVGFIQDEDFEVYLSESEQYKNERLIYFDSQGRVTDGEKGKAGGGFIIANIDPGSASVIVIGSKSERIFTQTIPVDPEKVTLMGAILK